MSSLVKILVIISCFWIDTAWTAPLFQGISFQRGFDISLKPYQRRPITFFKEKWSPFGIFGSRRTISKREVESVDQDTAAEPALDVETQNEDNSLAAGSAPARVVEALEPLPPPPMSSIVYMPGGRGPLGSPASQVSRSPGLYTNIGPTIPANGFPNLRASGSPFVAPVVEPQPAPPANTPQENTSVTSRFASFIGNAFVQFLTQFFTNARLSLNRFGQ